MDGIDLSELIYWYVAKVHKVYDGDTFTEVSTRLGLRSVHERERFRLIGIQANEIRGRNRTLEYKELADAAKRRLRELTYGEVLLRTYKASKNHSVDKYGKYGRWLCSVYVPLKRLEEKGSKLEFSTFPTWKVDNQKVVKDICGEPFVNLNLLLVLEGLAVVKHY